MKFKNIHKEGENVLFEVVTTHEEVSYLVNYAVQDLLAKGILSLEGDPSQDVPLTGVSH